MESRANSIVRQMREMKQLNDGSLVPQDARVIQNGIITSDGSFDYLVARPPQNGTKVVLVDNAQKGAKGY